MVRGPATGAIESQDTRSDVSRSGSAEKAVVQLHRVPAKIVSGLADFDPFMALVGRYETYEQLGLGSTGTVYRARDTVLGREVALRILNRHTRVSSRLTNAFSATGQIPPEWLHPNIAVIYDLGRAPVGEFVATELLAGANLRNYIRDRSTLTLLQKLDLLAQAAKGLAHAHQSGIVHGAIRPASFFIDERQNVKILDFGIRYLDLPEEAIARNPALLEYCSPEQLSGSPCDIRSDIFSAALVFYEFLVFAHPFRDPNVTHRISNDAPDSLLRHDPTLPLALETLLSRALAKNPAHRVQSIQELASGFRSIESQLLVGATPRVSPPEQTPAAKPAMPKSRVPQSGKPGLSSFSTKVAATAAFACCLIFAAYLVNLNKRVEKSHAIAEADVHTESTALLQSPDLRSRTLATLIHGTPIEILDHAPAPTDRFVKAQARFSGKVSTGYIAAADLWDWRSADPRIAWDLLHLSEPQRSSAPTEVKEYLAALGAYIEHFPDAPEVSEAKLKQQQMGEWLVPPPSQVAAVQPPALPPVPQETAEREQESQQMLKPVAALWEEGNLETILDVTQKALALNPANASARSWRLRAQKALRKLNDQ